MGNYISESNNRDAAKEDSSASDARNLGSDSEFDLSESEGATSGAESDTKQRSSKKSRKILPPSLKTIVV
jgi:hypothetical protein